MAPVACDMISSLIPTLQWNRCPYLAVKLHFLCKSLDISNCMVSRSPCCWASTEPPLLPSSLIPYPSVSTIHRGWLRSDSYVIWSWLFTNSLIVEAPCWLLSYDAKICTHHVLSGWPFMASVLTFPDSWLVSLNMLFHLYSSLESFTWFPYNVDFWAQHSQLWSLRKCSLLPLT